RMALPLQLKRLATLQPLFAFAPLLVSCSSSASSSSDLNCASSPVQNTTAGMPTEFIAYPSSFDCFHSWNTAAATAPSGASDGLHVGPLEVYWNQSPPHGS